MLTRRKLFGMLAALPFAGRLAPTLQASEKLTLEQYRLAFDTTPLLGADEQTYITLEWDAVEGATGYRVFGRERGYGTAMLDNGTEQEIPIRTLTAEIVSQRR